MKRTIILFIIAALVVASVTVWLLSSGGKPDLMDSLHFGVIILVVLFALYVGYKRVVSIKRGEPAEDELSKRVLLKTAAYSYYISLYIWVFLLFIKDRIHFDSDQLIGTGVLGMALAFGITWIILNFRGIKNE